MKEKIFIPDGGQAIAIATDNQALKMELVMGTFCKLRAVAAICWPGLLPVCL